MTILSWLIVVLAFVTMLRFIFDGIIVPSLRMHYRFQLFAMRDELRSMLTDERFAIPADVFRASQSQINTAVSSMDNFHLSLLYQSYQAFKADPELSRQAESHRALIKSFQNESFVSLQKRFSHISVAVLLTNSAGILLWIVPLIAVLLVFTKIKQLTLKTLQLPESRLDSFYGQHRTSAA